jgi:hypothetical protein
LLLNTELSPAEIRDIGIHKTVHGIYKTSTTPEAAEIRRFAKKIIKKWKKVMKAEAAADAAVQTKSKSTSTSKVPILSSESASATAASVVPSQSTVPSAGASASASKTKHKEKDGDKGKDRDRDKSKGKDSKDKSEKAGARKSEHVVSIPARAGEEYSISGVEDESKVGSESEKQCNCKDD